MFALYMVVMPINFACLSVRISSSYIAKHVRTRRFLGKIIYYRSLKEWQLLLVHVDHLWTNLFPEYVRKIGKVEV